MLNKLPAILAGIVAVALWGSIPAFVKVGVVNFPIAFLLLCRFLIGTALVAPVFLRIRWSSLQVGIPIWLGLLVVLGANYFFQTVAMSELPAGWYIVIFSLSPVLSLLTLRIPMRRSTALTCALAGLSTLVFLNAAEFQGRVTIIGVLCLLVGMVTWVGYTALAAKLQKNLSDSEVTALTQLISLVSVFVIWVASGVPIAQLQPQSLGAVLLLGVTSPLAYFCFSYSLRRAPVFSVTSQYLEPVFGLALAIFYLREPTSVQQLLAATLVILSMSWLAAKELNPSAQPVSLDER